MADTMQNQLKKHQFIPFLDTSGLTASGTWKRIIKSTIFDLGLNAEEETKDYISDENPSTVLKSYNPELPQENELYENDPVYDFLIDMLFYLKVGDSAKVPVLLAFGGSDAKAWKNLATIVITNLNTVDGKLTYTIKFGGTMERGTYTIAAGVPVFTPEVETPAEPTP